MSGFAEDSFSKSLDKLALRQPGYGSTGPGGGYQRLGFNDEVEPITLTWENINVFVTSDRSTSTGLKSLAQICMKKNFTEPKQILQNGRS